MQLSIAQTRITDISQPSIKGKVKHATIYTFRGGNGETPDTTAISGSIVDTFDENGRQLTQKNYDSNNSLKEAFTFENSGDSIAVMNQLDDKGMLLVKYIYKYDSQGKETEFDMESPEQPKYHLAKIDYKCLMKYDDAGNRISEEQYINKKELTMKTTSVYNSKNERIQTLQQSFFGNRAEETKGIYSYDDKGNLTKSDTYDSKGNLTGSRSFLYDKFDTHDNWLIQIVSQKAHTQQGDYVYKGIIKRVIEYY